MEPKKVEKTGPVQKEEDNNEREQHGVMEKKERRVKNNEERGRIILGLRLSRKRLHFLFQGHGGIVEHWGFRGARLADNQWHTLVLVVDSRQVRLTVDCSLPLEM